MDAMASSLSSFSSVTPTVLAASECSQGRTGRKFSKVIKKSGNVSVANSWTFVSNAFCLQRNLVYNRDSLLVPVSGKDNRIENIFLNRQDVFFLSNGKSNGAQLQNNGAQLQNNGRKCAVRAGMREAQELVISKKVMAWTPKEAGRILSEGNENWKLLDVRPIWERERAFVSDSLHIPLFVVDDDDSFLTAIKRQIQFGFGGWWLGQKLTKKNENFVEEVKQLTTSVDTPIMIACGEGLRSLMAIEALYEAGYEKLGWVAGGLNNSREGDFASVEGETKLQFSTAGGVQGILLKVGQYVNGLQKREAPSP